MKKKIISVFSIVCCGCLLVSFCKTSSQVENQNLTAGVTEVTTVNIEEAPAVQVSQSDAVTTAAADNSNTTYGYTNIGVANVQGNLNVRTEPSETSSLVGKMPENAGCEILEVAGDWIKIQSGDVTGYVLGSYLLTGDAAKSKAAEVAMDIATVNTQTLYVRAEQNTNCTILALMPMGEELNVVANLGEWIQVDVDGETGYVSSTYVNLSTELPKAMTITEIRYGQGVSDARVDLVSYATQFVGNPYVWGGTSLTKGADCSGFTLSIYRKYGVSLPHSSKAQANCGTRIKASEAQPGDLFFYGSGKSISHVAIYIGNGQIVHASSKKTGIKISNAYYRSPICVVRLLN